MTYPIVLCVGRVPLPARGRVADRGQALRISPLIAAFVEYH